MSAPKPDQSREARQRRDAAMRAEYVAGERVTDIADRHGVSASAVYKIAQRDGWPERSIEVVEQAWARRIASRCVKMCKRYSVKQISALLAPSPPLRVVRAALYFGGVAGPGLAQAAADHSVTIKEGAG